MEDWIVGYKSQVAFFQRMKEEVPDYPIRFVLFDSGAWHLAPHDRLARGRTGCSR